MFGTERRDGRNSRSLDSASSASLRFAPLGMTELFIIVSFLHRERIRRTVHASMFRIPSLC